jgi:hypothetical protein
MEMQPQILRCAQDDKTFVQDDKAIFVQADRNIVAGDQTVRDTNRRGLN